MSEKQTIERAVQAQGWIVKSWDENHENGLSALVGRFKAVGDDESSGLYSGDEGELMACVVGRSDLGNQRVSWWLSRDEYGDADISELSLVDPVV